MGGSSTLDALFLLLFGSLLLGSLFQGATGNIRAIAHSTESVKEHQITSISELDCTTKKALPLLSLVQCRRGKTKMPLLSILEETQ